MRRHVSELKRGVSTSTSTAATVAALQTTVSSLQQTLAEALYRTAQLENKTAALEAGQRGAGADGIDDKNIYYASRSPKTTYYYLDAGEKECDKNKDQYGLDCSNGYTLKIFSTSRNKNICLRFT